MEILSCIWIEKEMWAGNFEQNFPIVKSKEVVSGRRKLKAKEFTNSSNSNQEPLGDFFFSQNFLHLLCLWCYHYFVLIHFCLFLV